MDDISIDRLILEIPGLSAEQGAELARQIGEQLATCGTASGDFSSVAITLEPEAVGSGNRSPQRLATAIVAALLRQVG
jgi:hypothetical protein